jgi:hypothetical protein
MTQLAAQQLDSIHSMLSAGHRNLRIERFSLILWGASGGGLILFSNRILTAEQYPVLEQRAIAWLILLVLAVSGVSMLDWHFTRRAKEARDEAWSFIHRQVFKVWWLLMSVGVLLTFATFFYGGKHMLFPAWLVLAGLGLYVHGLFSEELLEWMGALIIAIGIGMLAFRLSYHESRWVAASTLGLGLPLLAAMLDRGHQQTVWIRLAQSVGWLLCVLALPVTSHWLEKVTLSPEAPLVTLQEFHLHPMRQQVIAMPAGSIIPVKVGVSGNVFRTGNQSIGNQLIFQLVLNEPFEIMMNNGQPTGDWRLPGGSWAQANETLAIKIPMIKANMTPQTGPEINSSLIVETQQQSNR